MKDEAPYGSRKANRKAKWARSRPGKERVYPEYESKVKVSKEALGKAVRALLQVCKKKAAGSGNQLFESMGETMVALFTLGIVPEQRKMRPFLVQLPHPLYDEKSEICFISKDPQKYYKELILEKLKPKGVTKVISTSKLRAQYQSMQSKKALADSFDLFLCDGNVIEMMPGILGNMFYKDRNKIPIPVKLEEPGIDPMPFFERAVNGTTVRIPAGPSLGVKVGLASFTEEQLVENVVAVIAGTVKLLDLKHKNYVNAISLQATGTPALPVWRRPAPPGAGYNLKEWKNNQDSSSSAGSDTGASGRSETNATASETEGQFSELPSECGETLSTRDTNSELETQDETTNSELDTETGDVDSEQAPEKSELPLVKGLSKRAKRKHGDDGTAAAAAEKQAAAEAAAEAKEKKKGASDDMPPPAKKAKKAKK